ncbi:MAG: AAA family ATPase [Actinomycetota bacterium]|nr:AAA family ATPase [Actinomycetota bacterium]
MPICLPQSPEFSTQSERQVWQRLRDGLGDDDLLIANQRVADRFKDHEIDLAVVLPGAGLVVIEVKGSQVSCTDGVWRILRNRRHEEIHPVRQVTQATYALRSYVERDQRWGSRRRIRWCHAIVLPYSEVHDGFAQPDCPRWSILGRDEMDDLVPRLRAIGEQQEAGHRAPELDDVHAIAAILRGRLGPQRDLIGAAAEREDVADRLTQEQAAVLDAIRLLPRVEVRGGAGSGKTWLAVEQARRLARQGLRVALMCYSRGLAAYLERRVETFGRRETPAYVGTFHGLGVAWGAAEGSDDDSDYWEHRLPAQMVQLARVHREQQRFDAIVVDEAQDFADLWWPALLAALTDEDTGRLYAFSDEGQRVFSRFAGAPAQMVPIVLDHNLRNTRQIGEVFNPLTPMRMRLLGGEGPAARLVPCRAADALETADDEVDRLLDDGWRPEDVALLATGSRHAEQKARQERGQDHYWASFWDAEQVFYGHVLGFKGLERRAVVLALNESEPRERSRERLYVGLSRARDQLVVCGDPEFVRAVGGSSVLRWLVTD